MLLVVACAQPSVEWIEGPTGENGQASQTLVLRNMPKGGRVWFQEIFDNHKITAGPVDQIHHYQGTSFYLDIPQSGTLTLNYEGRPLPRHSWAPEGFVLQVMGKASKFLPVDYKFLERSGSPINASWFAASYEPGVADIIPRPWRVEPWSEPVFEDEECYIYYDNLIPDGSYTLILDDKGEAHIDPHDADGEYYAQVTLSKLPEGTRNLTISDWPTLGLRGFMLDVVRDFRSKEEVYKILDIMAE